MIHFIQFEMQDGLYVSVCPEEVAAVTEVRDDQITRVYLQGCEKPVVVNGEYRKVLDQITDAVAANEAEKNALLEHALEEPSEGRTYS